MGLMFFAIFGGFGMITLRSGIAKMAKASAAYRNGVPVHAVVTDIGSSSYQVNNRSATVFHYQFFTNDVAVKGEHHSWAALDLEIGDTVTVLYDEANAPKHGGLTPSVLFAPEQFDASARVREQLERRHRASHPDVSLDLRHPSPAEETAASAPVEEKHEVW